MSLAASRWVSLGLLMNKEEWRQFFLAFPLLRLFNVSAVVEEGHEEFSLSGFLDLIQRFTEEIQHKTEIDLAPYRIPFSCALSEKKEDFMVQSLPHHRCLIKPLQPVIQLRPLTFSVSPEGEIQTKSWGRDHNFWGIQFSYPQLFQDPQSKKIIHALADHPNGVLFKKTLRWFRFHTKPAVFKESKKSLAFALKVGKESVYLLSKHQQLKKNHLELTV